MDSSSGVKFRERVLVEIVEVTAFLGLPFVVVSPLGFGENSLALLPPMSRLPLLENSMLPGIVRSSKLMDGISEVWLGNEISGSLGGSSGVFKGRAFSSLHFLNFLKDDGDCLEGPLKRGKLCDFRML